jgi:hypothetical protein
MVSALISKMPVGMPFVQFAQAMQATGAVNRFPAIGAGPDVYSYSVYMNGPLAAGLPAHAQVHTFTDLPLHALTRELGLNSGLARDNLKVAEVVAIRNAWMSAVLESSYEVTLSGQAVKDYELLSEGMTHPWIVGELAQHRTLAAKLTPALVRAGLAKDVIPRETSVGKVVAQDSDFTFQRTTEGEVVTHENKRLDALPAVGAEIMVSYYRGQGQVVNSLEKLTVSPPFIDALSEDLAIVLEDGQGLEQVVLFNSISSFSKFVKAHGMDDALVRQAMDVREASPKAVAPPPKRDAVGVPYMDSASGCIAADYTENGVVYSALFGSAAEMTSLAREFDLGAKALSVGGLLATPGPDHALASATGLRLELNRLGHHDIASSDKVGCYSGKIVAESALHVAQHIGRGAVVVHDLRKIDKVASVGDNLTVKFEAGRGRVSHMEKGAKSLAR